MGGSGMGPMGAGPSGPMGESRFAAAAVGAGGGGEEGTAAVGGFWGGRGCKYQPKVNQTKLKRGLAIHARGSGYR